MLKIYFFGFVFMAFQALGDARHAICFSLLRKAGKIKELHSCPRHA